MKIITIMISVLFSTLAWSEYLENVYVTDVTDGDTFHAIHLGKKYKVRLSEIDAPEKQQEMGQTAAAFLATLLEGNYVDLETTGSDRYGRLLARVFLDGKDINMILVNNGMAWAYEKYLQDKSFLEAQKQAKENSLGLWSLDKPTPPWVWRSKPIIKSCCRVCKKGKPCGDSCINSTYSCKKPTGCACSKYDLQNSVK